MAEDLFWGCADIPTPLGREPNVPGPFEYGELLQPTLKPELTTQGNLPLQVAMKYSPLEVEGL